MWWKGSPGQEKIMLPALRSFCSSLAVFAFASSCAISAIAQGPSPLLPESESSDRPANARGADPVTAELISFGNRAPVISQARSAVLAILTAQNSCSAWFRSAEPEAAEKFRSLRFAVDYSGSPDIVRVESWERNPVYYQPYAARTGQNVGWGSTITLNDKGAFFRNSAPIRIDVDSLRHGYAGISKRLFVGDFSGATREVQILTLLHEFGHVVDLLPVDAGVAAGPQISTRNTELVLRHCGGAIRKAARQMFVYDSAFLAGPPPFAVSEKSVRTAGILP